MVGDESEDAWQFHGCTYLVKKLYLMIARTLLNIAVDTELRTKLTLYSTLTTIVKPLELKPLTYRVKFKCFIDNSMMNVYPLITRKSNFLCN